MALLAGWGGTHWDEFHFQLGSVCAIYGLKYHRSIFSSVVHCEMHGGQGSRQWSCLFSPLAVALCQYHSYKGGQRGKTCSVFPVQNTVFWGSIQNKKESKKTKPKQNNNKSQPQQIPEQKPKKTTKKTPPWQVFLPGENRNALEVMFKRDLLEDSVHVIVAAQPCPYIITHVSPCVIQALSLIWAYGTLWTHLIPA